MCHFSQLPYMDRRSMEPLALCVTSFNDVPYTCFVFSDILVALCVYLYNIYTLNVYIYSQLPYVSL